MLLNTSLHHLTERRRRTPREGSGAPEGSQGQREAGGPLHPQSAGGDGGSLREAAHSPAAPAAAAPHAAAAAEPGLSAEPHVVGETLYCFQGVERVASLALASSSLQRKVRRPLGDILDAKIYIFSSLGATFCEATEEVGQPLLYNHNLAPKLKQTHVFTAWTELLRLLSDNLIPVTLRLIQLFPDLLEAGTRPSTLWR